MGQSSSSGKGRTIRSVRISLDVIEALQASQRMGVTALARELGHSKSTIHSHLRTLEEAEIIVRERNGYRLSLRILQMATHVRDQVGNYDVIRDEVEEVAVQTGEIAHFGIEEYGCISYLSKAAGDRAVETLSSVGSQQPIYSTSLGKTILAHLPADRRDEIVNRLEYVSQTRNTITNDADLYDELETVREQGYGIDDEETFPGLRCVSAPVRDDTIVLGAISITGPSSRFTRDRLHGDLRDSVQRAANVIELNTKFSSA